MANDDLNPEDFDHRQPFEVDDVGDGFDDEPFDDEIPGGCAE